MSADLILRLQSELDTLQTEKVRIDGEIAEIQRALKVINKYSASSGFAPSKLEQGSALGTLFNAPSKQQQILDGVSEILSDGKPRHTADLLVELVRRGIGVGGEKPEANLSAYLSRAKDMFVNDRRLGWSLKKQNPESVAAQSGSGDGVSAADDPLA